VSFALFDRAKIGNFILLEEVLGNSLWAEKLTL